MASYLLGPNLSSPKIVGLRKPLLIRAHKNNKEKAPIPMEMRYCPCNCGSNIMRIKRVKAA